jgi:arylsulfatase A-like enzyme
LGKKPHLNIPVKPLILRLIALLLMAASSGMASPDKQPLARPNILWITGEDMSAKWLGCYGNTRIKTPHFDKFAKEGFLYTRCFATVPVCAPARNTWITGIYPTSSGTIYMRSQNELPDTLAWYPDSLRANGYFTANFTKTDYNTSNRIPSGLNSEKNKGIGGQFVNTWDTYENDCWKHPEREPVQPFFQVDNSVGCHESYLHNPKNTNGNVDPAGMKLAAYHPDIPEIRMDYARNTAGVMGADKTLGKILAKLEADGLTDDTIVIYTSDHGGIIGRSKRFLYDSGTHAALIIRIPEKFKHLWPASKPGTEIDRLISFIDMPKTWLAITGSTIPPEMQGNVFLGDRQDAPRESVFIARDRMDEVPDMQRAIRDSQYLYIRNYESYKPNGQFLEYLWQAPSMKAWEAYHRSGKSDALTGSFFRPKPVEELFDCQNDPDNVRNLAEDPAHAARLAKMRDALEKQQLLHHDCGFLPEGMLMHRVKTKKSTVYDYIRNLEFYPQAEYMTAANLANFAKPAELPKLIELLKSDDAGRRYWGVNGCIRLGNEAATPEILTIMKELIASNLADEESLDVRASAAYFLCKTGHHSEDALLSLAQIISAPGNSMAKCRAWANVFLLGTKAAEIENPLIAMKLDKINGSTLDLFLSRIR